MLLIKATEFSWAVNSRERPIVGLAVKQAAGKDKSGGVLSDARTYVVLVALVWLPLPGK